MPSTVHLTENELTVFPQYRWEDLLQNFPGVHTTQNSTLFTYKLCSSFHKLSVMFPIVVAV